MESVDQDADRALRARFNEVYGQYQRVRSGLDDLRQRLADLRVTERSDDGQVAATVGPRGQLVTLELGARVHDHSPETLAVKITETVQRAADSATTAVQELVAGYLPAGSGAVDFMADGDFGALLRRSEIALQDAERT